MGRSDLTFTDAPPNEGGAASAKRVSVLSGMYKRHRAACLTCHLASTCPAPATVPGTHPTTPTISPKCLSLFSLPHLSTLPYWARDKLPAPTAALGLGSSPIALISYLPFAGSCHSQTACASKLCTMWPLKAFMGAAPSVCNSAAPLYLVNADLPLQPLLRT